VKPSLVPRVIKKLLLFPSLTLLICVTGGVRAQAADFRFQDYVTAQIGVLNREHSQDSAVDKWIDAASPKYKVRINFLGKSRIIPQDAAMLLDNWAQALGHPPTIRSLFVHEVLVREADVDYWMPIQEPVRKWLFAEVASGDAAELYIMRIGSIRSKPVYAINEFQVLAGDH
jgi:hypothetical protein